MRNGTTIHVGTRAHPRLYLPDPQAVAQACATKRNIVLAALTDGSA